MLLFVLRDADIGFVILIKGDELRDLIFEGAVFGIQNDLIAELELAEIGEEDEASNRRTIRLI